MILVIKVKMNFLVNDINRHQPVYFNINQNRPTFTGTEVAFASYGAANIRVVTGRARVNAPRL